MQAIFIGSDGLRAGWRIALYLLIFVVLTLVLLGAVIVIGTVTHHGKGLMQRPTGISIARTFVGEGITVPSAIGAALVMGLIEKRPFAAYGLPLRTAFGARFWEGALWGVLAIGAVAGTIAATGGFTSEVVSSGFAAVRSLVLWALAFITVGLAEEFLFRGYVLYTLGRGIRFVPAAIVMGLLFAVAHGANPGETPTGLASIVVFALVFSFALWRTGSLWFAVGFHFAWDWGQTAFLGTFDSGLKPSESFLLTTFHGAPLISGGTVGPEASIFTPIALLVVFALLFVRFRHPGRVAAGSAVA